MNRSLAAVFALLLIFVAGAAEAHNVQRVLSPKGIEAWLVQEDKVPLVAISFAFVGGSSQDPADRPGVANMLSDLLDEGAGDLDSQAYQAALDDYAIELSFDVDHDAFYGSVRTLVENRDEMVKLLKLALTKPRFDDEPVERIRAQIEASIRGNERDPDQMAGDALRNAAFPGHPYGRPVQGTSDSVTAITTGDLRTFFAHTFARNNLKVAVVGAIDAAALGRLLDDVFGDLPIKSDLTDVPETIPLADRRLDIAMTIPQTVIRFGGRGLKRNDPDYIPASVAAYILGGGGFSSRLYSEVREKRGLAYSISLGLAPFDHAGAVFGGTSTRSDQAEKVVSLIEEEIKRFATDGPTPEELAHAKSYLIGSYPLRFSTSTRAAGQLLAIQMDNLGLDYVDRRNGLVAAVTIDDVRRVAKRLFGDSDLIVVRVGQPQS
jgi:zinc protease